MKKLLKTLVFLLTLTALPVQAVDFISQTGDLMPLWCSHTQGWQASNPDPTTTGTFTGTGLCPGTFARRSAFDSFHTYRYFNNQTTRRSCPLNSTSQGQTENGNLCRPNEGYSAVNTNGTWSVVAEGQEGCVSPAVYDETTGLCTEPPAPTPEEACRAKNGQVALQGDIELGYDDAAIVPTFACHDGCLVQFSGDASATSRSIINGKWVYYGSGTYTHTNGLNEDTGTACTEGEGGLAGAPQTYPTGQPKPDEGCGLGHFMVNTTPPQCVKEEGYTVVDMDSENPPPTTTETTAPPVTNPDGGSTQTTTKTNPDGSKEITTKTTGSNGQITTEVTYVPAPGQNPIDGDPNGDEEGTEFPDDYAKEGTQQEIADSLLGIEDALTEQGDVPILPDIDDSGIRQLINGSGLTSVIPSIQSGSGVCPTGSFEAFGQTYTIDAQCALFEEIRGVLTSAAFLFWLILAATIVLGA